MSFDFDQIVENHFKERRDIFGFESIAQLIEEVMDGEHGDLIEMAVRGEEGETIEIKLPAIRFTENWGKIEGADRERIELYMSRIEGDTLAEKLTSLNSVLSGALQDPSVGTILSTLIMIEILSALAGTEREFTESAAGFIFEGFLAGLFGGQSVQITDVDPDAEQVGKPITDVELGGIPYSLKLLGPGTAVKGSWKNMIGHFEADEPGYIIYLDARRTGDGGLHFSEFTITLDDYLKIFADPFKKHYKSEDMEVKDVAQLRSEVEKLIGAEARIKAIIATKKFPGERHTVHQYNKETERDGVAELLARSDEELETIAPFWIRHQLINLEGSVMKKLFGTVEQYNAVVNAIETGNKNEIIAALKATAGYSETPAQFSFSKDQVRALPTYVDLPTIPLGEDALRAIWKSYGSLLTRTIQPVYGALQEFSNNVDRFFLDAPGKKHSRHEYGDAAIQDATDLQHATDRAVQAIADPRQLGLPGIEEEK